MTARIVVQGELFVAVADVAAVYGVEVAWVERVYASGLIGRAVVAADTRAIAARYFDRIARLRRLELQTGLDVDQLAMLFDWDGV